MTKKYRCNYHIKGVEVGSHDVEAKDINIALAMCNLWLYSYSNNQYYEVLSIELLDK